MMYFFCLILLAAVAGQDVQVQNLRLFYGEQEYFIKGMAYSPSPLDKIYDGQNTGPGLCDTRPTYQVGSYSSVVATSGCLTEDYFDGTVYTPGPTDGWWSDVWARDFPLMQQLGVNTIRIYHAYPITQTAIQNGAYTDKTVLGSNHLPFMNLAQAYDLKVLFPLYAESAELDTLDASFIQEYIRNLIDEVGNHPALLMYSFGNELQFSSRDATYIAKINSYIDYARAYQTSKWGRKIPITVALIDIPTWYQTLVTSLHFDIVTTNAGYRGFDFTDLWSTNLFGLSCQTGIPSLIGEMGVHQDTPQFNIPSWFPQMFADIIRHKTQGAIGGFYFSWVEEHWKGVVPGGPSWTTYSDVYMGVFRQTPGTGTYPVDVLVPKYGGAYDWAAAQYGFAEDPFSQDSAKTLGSAPADYCDNTFPLLAEQQFPSVYPSSTFTTISYTQAPPPPQSTTPVTPAPSTGSPATPTPSTGSPATPAPSTGSPATPTPSTGSPATPSTGDAATPTLTSAVTPVGSSATKSSPISSPLATLSKSATKTSSQVVAESTSVTPVSKLQNSSASTMTAVTLLVGLALLMM